ncbi:MAG TPA: DUF1559 domain-containing protein, partial [Verrucomicrobiae bacterium]|nr:DUF1559 domain-containing protein [Verrucomicrobiae bacterium]
HARERGRRIVCLNNVRQLGLAMQVYWGDHRDVSPAAGLAGEVWLCDWLQWPDYWHGVGGAQHTGIQRPVPGVLMPYVGNPAPKLLWCPSDLVLSRTLWKLNSFPTELSTMCPFSYGLNCGTRATGPPALWPGMASVIPAKGIGFTDGIRSSLDALNLHNFTATAIKSPSQKILFADKCMAYEDSSRVTLHGTVSAAWFWPTDGLTTRHSGRGTVACADGHVEAVKPTFGTQREHYDPLY